MTSGTRPALWWRGMLGYEVYLRSFCDGNGDGVGDLPGLLTHLDYLAWLGVDTVWITPFYPSPMADHGYDITDHCAVDPRYGTLEDLDAVVVAAHRLGMRVVIDLVPNHTSDQHSWFVEARRGRDDPRHDWYVWRPPGPGGGPPNNWVSYFGGPAWTFDEHLGCYYLHLFLPEQPDLNWAHPGVVHEFDRILDFWLDRGIDGFRVDVAQGLHVDPDFRDNPILAVGSAGTGPRAEFNRFEHRFDILQLRSLEVFRRWRERTDRSGAVLLGEVYVDDPRRIRPYVADDDGLHVAFTFSLMDTDWDAPSVADALRRTCGDLGPGACWVQASHDEPRPVTRFGGGPVGAARARALATLLCGLPGALVFYQGEELGLADGVVPPQRAADPMATRNRAAEDSRDGCRTPMPWGSGPSLGFSTSAEPWLPMGGRTAADTVGTQRSDPSSALHWYRQLIEVRRSIRRGDAEVVWLVADDHVVGYRRPPTTADDGTPAPELVVAAALGAQGVVLDPGSGEWDLQLSSSLHRLTGPCPVPVTLEADEAVVLVARGASAGTDDEPDDATRRGGSG